MMESYITRLVHTPVRYSNCHVVYAGAVVQEVYHNRVGSFVRHSERSRLWVFRVNHCTVRSVRVYYLQEVKTSKSKVFLSNKLKNFRKEVRPGVTPFALSRSNV